MKHEHMLFDCSDELERYNCQTCPSFETACLTSLRAHVFGGHRAQNPEEQLHKCQKCPYVTHSRFILVRHDFFNECAARNAVETEVPFVFYKNARIESESGNGPATLPHRDYATRPDRLKPGEYLNEPTKPIFKIPITPKDVAWAHCELCPYKCKTKRNLKTHMLFSHTNPEDIQWFVCAFCPSKFKRNDHLKRHVVSCHTNAEFVRWINCEQCPSKFKRKEHLRKHIVHCHTTPECIQWIDCAHCPSKFKVKSNLARHMKLAHTKPEDINWHECEHCPARFKQRSKKNRHLISCHSNSEDVQWFQCDQCPYRCKRNDGLTAHKQSRHI